MATKVSKFDPYQHLNIEINPDGSITRHIKLPSATTNPDPNSGEAVVSKDVTLHPERNTSIRIYLPTKLSFKDTTNRHLPIVMFFHDCSWVQFPAKNFVHHLSESYDACNIPAIIVLVDYRLAPESRLPAQYDDAMDALLWLKKQATEADGERWLKDYGDFSKCYLYGTGSGGNIVFHTALRALDVDLKPLNLAGIIMNQPLLGGLKRTKSEIKYAADQILPLPALDVIWELALPKGTNRDHRFCNPMVDGPHKDKLHLLPKCLVFGFGMDPLVDRLQDFVQMLVMNGVKVEAQFDEAGFHRIEFVDARRANAINDMVKIFINS